MSLSEYSVLIVDDANSHIDILVEALADDYDVRAALDGESALKSVEESQPDLILLDIDMPEMDGYEVCKLLKENPESRDIPVIFATALSEIQNKEIGFQIGGVDYITKPFEVAEVKARVATHLALQQQRQQLQENYQRLSKLEKLRDSLVHMLVHDLRSPLFGIQGCLQILQMDLEDKINEEQKDSLQTVVGTTQNLIEMVSSMLDISRLETGMMPLNRKACDLQPTIVRALDSLGALSRNHNISLQISEQPLQAYCDTNIIERVISNLVVNALKFIPTSGEVRITATNTSNGAKLAVTDSGPGIPLENQERIFEKFDQVEAYQKGTMYSSGIGLTFCKLAVEAHGGTIGVESVEGKGSTFWFCLPTTENVIPDSQVVNDSDYV